ncbi:MAG TPA: hypothetical protein GXX25_12055 [Desulfotomaculum sp.]|nr:hypothetical protein [Desulfotomaculum sp.]
MLVNATWEEALEFLLDRITPLPGESVSLLQALGRVVARDIPVTRDIPPIPRRLWTASPSMLTMWAAAPVSLSKNVSGTGIFPSFR